MMISAVKFHDSAECFPQCEGGSVIVKAALCGCPRIRRFAKLVIRESADLRERFNCRLEASGSDELQCDCRVFVKITNLNPESSVLIPAREIFPHKSDLVRPTLILPW